MEAIVMQRAHAGRREPHRETHGRVRLPLAAPARTHPHPGPYRPGTRPDGHPDPALTRAGGLAEGNVTELTDNLRVAFGVTVAGLLTGAIAFSVSLVRDRLYAQDFSDVEYAAANLSPDKHLPDHLVPSTTEHGGTTRVSMGNP